MSKLSFDALSERADQVATEDLLNSINGGTENDCHDGSDGPVEKAVDANADTDRTIADALFGWLFD